MIINYYRFDETTLVYLGYVGLLDGMSLEDTTFYVCVSPKNPANIGDYVWNTSENIWKDKE